MRESGIDRAATVRGQRRFDAALEIVRNMGREHGQSMELLSQLPAIPFQDLVFFWNFRIGADR